MSRQRKQPGRRRRGGRLGREPQPLVGAASWTPVLAEVADELGIDERPPCAVCRARGRRLHYMTHGVAVWLCDGHADDSYLRRDAGRAFVRRLAGSWAAVGALTARRVAALQTHVRQGERAGSAPRLPGSYGWPELRREAEKRFAAGEDPNHVIDELRARHARGPARVPTARTMRRWFTDARWLAPTPGRPWRWIKDWWDDRAWVPLEFVLLPKAMIDVLPLLYPSLDGRKRWIEAERERTRVRAP